MTLAFIADLFAPVRLAPLLFASAKAGNVTAQIFWLKVRAHWREKTVPDHPVPGSDAEANSPVVLVLLDNSRDPELTQLLQTQKRNISPGNRGGSPRTQDLIERLPVQTETTVGTLPESGRNPVPGDQGETASAAGM